MFSNIQSGSSGDSGDAFQLNFIVSCQSTDLCQNSLTIADVRPITDSFTPTIRLAPGKEGLFSCIRYADDVVGGALCSIT